MMPTTMPTVDPTLIEVPQTLETERLLLSAPCAGTGGVVSQVIAASMDSIKPWLHWAQSERSAEQCEAVVRQEIAEFVLRKHLRYQVYDRAAPAGHASRRYLGAAGLLRIDWAVRRFEIGYWLRSDAQGRGYCSEAVRALAEMAFSRLRARRVEIRMDSRNQASRAVAERCGFELEGILRREGLSPQGEIKDTCVYSRIA